MIFTGLSNNWALLQRVNAIEKYLSENPIVPYAKASVAGEGTDTFVFNKSQLSVANGADLMVGDLIICPDVTLWQVISIADSGEVTARYLVNFRGEQGIQGIKGDTGETGPQGPQGPAGTGVNKIIEAKRNLTTVTYAQFKDYGTRAVQIDNVENKSEINVGDFVIVQFIISDRNNSVGYIIGECSSTPAGVNFIIINSFAYNCEGSQGPQGPAGKDGIGIDTLSELGNAFNNATPPIVTQNHMGFVSTLISKAVYSGGQKQYNQISIIPIKATNGIVADVSEDGKFIELHAELYLHRIFIRQSNISAVRFELLTRSATELTYADIASLINSKYNTATGYAGKDPTSPTQFGNSVYCVNATNGVISAICQNGQSIELETANVTITDTVEEI